MKSKLILTLVALTLILVSGCAMGMGGGGMMSHHGAMMGGHGATGQQGVDQDSNASSEELQEGTGHDHGVPSTGASKGNPQSYQPHGGPPYCP